MTTQCKSTFGFTYSTLICKACDVTKQAIEREQPSKSFAKATGSRYLAMWETPKATNEEKRRTWMRSAGIPGLYIYICR